MPHRLALRGGEPGNVPDDRLGDVLLDVVRGAFLGVPIDLADHHDDVGLGVRLEFADRVDVGGADDRVPADADRARGSEVAQLVHHLVGEGARLRYQADARGPGDVGGGDAEAGCAGDGDATAGRAA